MRTISKAKLFKELGTFQSVKNTPSRNGCGKAPNQFELTFENGSVFQSYNTMIAVRHNGRWYFTNSHDCSMTTSGYTSRFCGYDTKERRKGLENGTFTLIVD